MKKYLLILLISFSFFSCLNEDTQFNTPAVEGIKDGELLFRSTYYAADIDNGGFIIEGGDNFQRIQLVTTIDAPGIYDLGGENFSRAIFKDELGIVFSTANAPDSEISVYPSSGQIIVTEVSNTTPKTVTGQFWFNAFTIDGLRSVNFSEGNFHKVPLIGGISEISNGVPCQEAINVVNNTFNDFNGLPESHPNYYGLCLAYKNALIVQVNSCGDPDGSLQALINSLGDCSGTN